MRASADLACAAACCSAVLLQLRRRAARRKGGSLLRPLQLLVPGVSTGDQSTTSFCVPSPIGVSPRKSIGSWRSGPLSGLEAAASKADAEEEEEEEEEVAWQLCQCLLCLLLRRQRPANDWCLIAGVRLGKRLSSSVRPSTACTCSYS